MTQEESQKVTEAFNSMLRADYIALSDTEKLKLLSFYYVDPLGHLGQILGNCDQLVVGRRGTGKTTLLYRAYVECMESWKNGGVANKAAARTLGIYLDLSKCSSIEDAGEFPSFEHAFVSELCDAIRDQLKRFWPALGDKANLLDRFLAPSSIKMRERTNSALQEFAELLKKGITRAEKVKDVEVETLDRYKASRSSAIGGKLGLETAELSPQAEEASENESSQKKKTTSQSETRLTASDVLRTLDTLRTNAGIPAILIFIDEFSSLSIELQRRFSTLLRKFLGSHSGIYIKLCAITDNYTLGTSIILQRDLFEVSLDLDAYVERNPGLPQAMAGLKEEARAIIEKRLAAYGCAGITQIIAEPDEACSLLSCAAMGVPRTLGIVLQQAWHNCLRHQHGIRKTDVEYGISYASQAYMNQMMGASKGGIAIPAHVVDLWQALLDRATQERSKERKPASHFLVLPKHEEALKYLNMFFLLHLMTKGRTTKKDSASRSLYCFDYGVCLERNLDFTTDKNVIRQQRFAYDDVIEPFMKYYSRNSEPMFQCSSCGRVYKESELQVAGTTLTFCPRDRADLKSLAEAVVTAEYTEEEIKIIGAIRSASKGDALIARRIADDVGCYVQKVAKFGEKLEKSNVVGREKDETVDKFIYFGPTEPV